MTTPQQVTMTLAALASTCATPRPSGESPQAHAGRIFAGIQANLTDPTLATGGTWEPVWVAMSPDNTNLCYIARNQAPGVNELAVAIRGTNASLADLLEDIDVGTVVPFTAGGSTNVAVAKGAMDAFTQIANAASQPGAGSYPGTTLVQALSAALGAAPPQPTVYVTGHSLGGCLATMVALYLRAQTWPQKPAFAVHTFAAPTAGLQSFADFFTAPGNWAAYSRTVNAYDVVPQAWVKADLDAIKNWYPSPGPAADLRVKAVVDVIAGLPGNNAYVQPGAADVLNNDPGHQYQLHNPALVNNTFGDFMGQAAFQHANNTYLTLLGAPAVRSAPVVTGVTPTAGQPGGSVRITGTGFTPGSAVDFGPIAATNVVVATTTEIIAEVPAGVGVVEVFVTTAYGTSAASPIAQFAYGGPEPVVVTSVSPTRGDRKNAVTITGSGFAQGCTVSFGGDQSPSVTWQSSNQITAVPPEHLAGTVDITVAVGVATSATGPAGEFTYTGLVAEPTLASTARGGSGRSR